MEAQGGRRYSSYSFTTSALDRGEWSALWPDRALPLGKGPPVPIVQEAVWAPEPVWTQKSKEKSFRLCRGSNLDLPVVQSVARLYTDWAIPAPSQVYDELKISHCHFLSKWVLTCMTPPPALFTLVCRNSSGRPIIFPNQFITTVSSSVHAGLDACKIQTKSLGYTSILSREIHCFLKG
jgi:hypothetical protein